MTTQLIVFSLFGSWAHENTITAHCFVSLRETWSLFKTGVRFMLAFTFSQPLSVTTYPAMSEVPDPVSSLEARILSKRRDICVRCKSPMGPFHAHEGTPRRECYNRGAIVQIVSVTNLESPTAILSYEFFYIKCSSSTCSHAVYFTKTYLFDDAQKFSEHLEKMHATDSAYRLLPPNYLLRPSSSTVSRTNALKPPEGANCANPICTNKSGHPNQSWNRCLANFCESCCRIAALHVSAVTKQSNGGTCVAHMASGVSRKDLHGPNNTKSPYKLLAISPLKDAGYAPLNFTTFVRRPPLVQGEPRPFGPMTREKAIAIEMRDRNIQIRRQRFLAGEFFHSSDIGSG